MINHTISHYINSCGCLVVVVGARDKIGSPDLVVCFFTKRRANKFSLSGTNFAFHLALARLSPSPKQQQQQQDHDAQSVDSAKPIRSCKNWHQDDSSPPNSHHHQHHKSSWGDSSSAGLANRINFECFRLGRFWGFPPLSLNVIEWEMVFDIVNNTQTRGLSSERYGEKWWLRCHSISSLINLSSISYGNRFEAPHDMIVFVNRPLGR